MSIDYVSRDREFEPAVFGRERIALTDVKTNAGTLPRYELSTPAAGWSRMIDWAYVADFL